MLSASKKADAEANIGHFFGALKIKGFRQVDAFNKDFDALVHDVKSSPLEPGVETVFIPGEPEILNKKENEKKGIAVLPPVLKKLQQIASELNLKL